MCSEKLDVSMDHTCIERAHRLGRFNRTKTRPIIVKFTSTKHKDAVLSDARKLKDTPYSVSEDFSPAVREARRKLLEYARARGGKFKLRFNRLTIGNETFVFDATNNSVVPVAR